MADDTDLGHEWGYAELRSAVDAAGAALWTWNVDTDMFRMDARGYELWNVPPKQDLKFEHLSAKIHPADRNRVRAAFTATRAVTGPYEIDFRILTVSEIRWISARGQGSDAGIDRRTMTGIFIDITGRKQAEEGNELLAGEMSHRVKNLLAIATALTKITSQSASSVADMTKQLTERLTALGRAHDLVRPLPSAQGKAALLGDLIAVLLAPYDDVGAFAGRVRVSVPRMGIGESALTGMALIVHELATNSLKHGALSVLEGTLDVSGEPIENEVHIIWMEHGGPTVAEPHNQSGYGQDLMRQMIEYQLGGSISYDWSPEGLIVKLTINAARLAL